MLTMSKIVCSTALCVVLGTVSASAASSKTNNGSTPNGQPFVHLSGAVASLQDQVNALAGRVDTLEEKATNLEAAMEELKEKNIELEEMIGQNERDSDAADAELQAQIDNNSRLIAAIQDEIDAINENIALGQHVKDGTCPKHLELIGIKDGEIVCVNKGSSTTFPVSQYTVMTITSLEPGEKKGIHSRCTKGRGHLLTGGGFKKYWDIEITDSRPHAPAITPELGGVNEDKAWYVVAKNHGTTRSYIYSAAQCLNFFTHNVNN